MKEKTISLRIDEDLHNFIHLYAQNKRTSVSQLITNFIFELYQKEDFDGRSSANQKESVVNKKREGDGFFSDTLPLNPV
jgi:hypothetical protein